MITRNEEVFSTDDEFNADDVEFIELYDDRLDPDTEQNIVLSVDYLKIHNDPNKEEKSWNSGDYPDKEVFGWFNKSYRQPINDVIEDYPEAETDYTGYERTM